MGILTIDRAKLKLYKRTTAKVHTAKIAIIEDEVTVLKRRVAELESKLN